MSKHLKALRNLTGLFLFSLYFALPPMLIVKWGVSNSIQGFSNTVPFYEAYSVIVVISIFGHAVLALFVWCTYGICYGGKEDE